MHLKATEYGIDAWCFMAIKLFLSSPSCFT